MNIVIIIAIIFQCAAILVCGYYAVAMIRLGEIGMGILTFLLAIVNALIALINVARLTGRI